MLLEIMEVLLFLALLQQLLAGLMLMAVDRVVAAARAAAVEMGLMEGLAAQDQIRLYLLLLPWGLVIDLMRTHQCKVMTRVFMVVVDLAV